MRQAKTITPPRAGAPPRWPTLLANETDLARLRAAGHDALAARVEAPRRTPSQTPVQGSYDARMMRVHREAAAPKPASAPPLGAGVLAAPVTTRPRTISHLLFLAAGLVLGILVVFPLAPLPANACPPAGEGLISCMLTKAWLPAVTKVAFVVLGAHLVARLLLDWIPQAFARYRRHLAMTRRRAAAHAAELRPAPAQRRDPLLTAATWGRPRSQA